LFSKPAWLASFEKQLAARVPLHPHVLSTLKLVFVTPLLLLALSQGASSPVHPLLVIGLFGVFAALDYLDGLVARQRGLATHFGRIFDRLTDYPLLVGVSYFCLDILPVPLLALKLGLDLLLLILFALGRGSTQNRLRTAVSYGTLLALLCLSQGWLAGLIGPSTVSVLLGLSIVLTAVVALYNLDILKKRYLADLLSLSNLGCGLFSIWFASQGKLEVSLLLLLLGATCDGLDGAAARRWGGSRWGVYSDDIADAVNFAIAPAAAVFFTLSGFEGLVIGGLYGVFTIGRLVFFTLDKQTADPDFFRGMPSPAGALMVLTALILFGSRPAIIGLVVGIAAAMMVSFNAKYRHLGRAVLARRQRLVAVVVIAGSLAWAALFWDPSAPIAFILAACVVYCFAPVAENYRTMVRGWASRRSVGRRSRPHRRPPWWTVSLLRKTTQSRRSQCQLAFR